MDITDAIDAVRVEQWRADCLHQHVVPPPTQAQWWAYLTVVNRPVTPAAVIPPGDIIP